MRRGRWRSGGLSIRRSRSVCGDQIGQDIYGPKGELETQVVYGADRDFDGVTFPSTIDINRPIDKYRIHLTIDKLTVNQPLADETFELKIPEGMQLQRMQ